MLNCKETKYIGYNYNFANKEKAKMIGKTKKKLISSLSQKKYRDKTGLFVAEGPKLINDLLTAGLTPEIIITTGETSLNSPVPSSLIETISPDELQKISFLKTPQPILGIFHKPLENFRFGDHKNRLTLALDGIQDPGNMGTIIRLADWFGIKTVVCTKDTADIYNPKVVQASMGALARVEVVYTELAEFCRASAHNLQMEIFGTFMDGKNIYQTSLPASGIIVMGNEGKGIRPETAQHITQRIAIPSFASGGMESLNVGIAAAIVCSEFKRSTSP